MTTPLEFQLKTEDVDVKIPEFIMSDTADQNAKDIQSEFTGSNSNNGFEKKNHCTTCNISFNRAASYTTHMIKIHDIIVEPAKVTLHCEYCNKAFANKWNHKRHMQRFHNPDIQSHIKTKIPIMSTDDQCHCEVCNMTFHRKYEYSRHVEKSMSHAQRAKRYNSAPESSNSQKKGKQRAHNGPVYCKECDLIFAESQSYMKHFKISITHIRTKNQQRKNASSFTKRLDKTLGRSLQSISSVRTPIIRSKSKEGFYCNDCSARLVTRRGYERHLVSPTHRMRLMQNKIVGTAPDVRNTANPLVKKEEESERFYCNDCQSTLFTKWGYKRHLVSPTHRMRVVQNKSLVKAPNCSTNSLHSNAIPLVKKEEDSEGFYCDDCQSKLITRWGYERHLVSPTHRSRLAQNGNARKAPVQSAKSINGVRTPPIIKKKRRGFYCKDCNARQITRSGHIRHMETTTHRTNLAKSKTLKDDVEIKIEARPTPQVIAVGPSNNHINYSCEICERTYFTRISDYALHMRSTHKSYIPSSVPKNDINKYPDPTNPHSYCRVCIRAYDSPHTYRRHVFETHGFRLPGFRSLLPEEGKDYSIDDNDTDGFCYLCQKVYEPKKYTDHLRKKHDICKVNRRFENRLCLFKPLPDPTDPDFYCRSCQRNYHVNAEFRRHLREVHKYVLPPFVNGSNNSNQDINSPNIRRDQYNFCFQCQKEFKTRTLYRRHVKSTHDIIIPGLTKYSNPSINPDPDDPNFYCRSCDSNHFFLSRYRNHLRSVHNIKLEPLVRAA